MAPIVKISFQILNVDASVSLKSVVLENRDIGLVMCESLDNMTILKLRATCKAGRTITSEVFCPVKAYKRVGFWLGYGNTDLFLSKLVEEGELRLLKHAHQIAHDSDKWDGSRVVWGRKVLIAAATSERIDILDWMHNHAEPKIKMDHKPTGLGLSTTAAARWRRRARATSRRSSGCASSSHRSNGTGVSTARRPAAAICTCSSGPTRRRRAAPSKAASWTRSITTRSESSGTSTAIAGKPIGCGCAATISTR